MSWFAQAPANIAFIKYMGKIDVETNLPQNSSLSYTVDDLQSFVEIDTHGWQEDFWEPLELPGAHPFNLNEAAKYRYLEHLRFLKNYFAYEGGLVVRSCNNFPGNNGLASSASSFAALTLCAARALSELTETPEPSMETLAKLSRQGSGSSCRSFFKPWALWSGDNIKPIELPYEKLIHHAIVVTHEDKPVSSSEAHERVLTSSLYPTRAERAENNLKNLLQALQTKDWKQAFQIIWNDFHDMHQLFETAEPPFHYMTDQSKDILSYFEYYWHQHNDGPLVTMDAGPNVHLFFRPEQAALAMQMKQKFIRDYDVI